MMSHLSSPYCPLCRLDKVGLIHSSILQVATLRQQLDVQQARPSHNTSAYDVASERNRAEPHSDTSDTRPQQVSEIVSTESSPNLLRQGFTSAYQILLVLKIVR